MYSQENYIWGLVAYGLGVLLVLPVMLKVTAFIMPWKPLRIFLRISFIALLVTPVYPYKSQDFLAPAWIVAFFETVRPTSPEGPAMAYALMTTVMMGLVVLTIGYYVGKFYWHKRAKSSAEGVKAGEMAGPQV